MRFWVGVTDNDWYDHLAALMPDEVNFWRPSGRGFGAIEAGSPFLFKLHSPLNYIVGGGFLVRAELLPVSLAWEAFGQKNGAPSYDDLRSLIARHRAIGSADAEIGCVILNQPFFIPREHWIPAPADWSANIVTGKTYDTREVAGRRLWDQVRPWAVTVDAAGTQGAYPGDVGEAKAFYGNEYLTRSRLGQGAFRVLVTAAYERRCAISGERTLPVLQASHIVPYGKGPNRVDNGLLLRSDLHILYDQGFLTVTPDHRVEISRRIKEKYENGRDYYRFHGEPLLKVPRVRDDWPNREYLEWHNREIFLA